jgi:formylglycine-generating enzyme required for sulfatase activity
MRCIARIMLLAITLPLAVSLPAPRHDAGSATPVMPAPDLIELRPSGAFRYRASGGFTRDGKPVTAPAVTIVLRRPLAFMRRQVTVAEYRICVEAHACPTPDRDLPAPDRPLVKVSWVDAQAYASWLSRETGKHFRLPTDEEWAYAAGSRFRDDAVPESSDPGRRALAIYDREAGRESIDKTPQPIGSFGANENDLLDIGGNVWEWTDTCYVRSVVSAQGNVIAAVANCGVRVVEGRHRAYMVEFLRDARSGGCGTGTPPSNLGFRLVRDDEPLSSVSLFTLLQAGVG